MTENDLKVIAEETVKLLTQKKLKIATAESCTGGMVSALITSVSGSSACFDLGICSYSPSAKCGILKIPDEIIEKYGTVSPETATKMAENIRQIANADIGISVTGVAGPNMSEGHPVGLVYIAISNAKNTTVKQLNIENNGRDYIRKTAVYEIFKLIENHLILED